MGTSFAQDDLTLDQSKRRSSFISWIEDDKVDNNLPTVPTRIYNWGPVGEKGFRDSIKSAKSRSPTSHHACNYVDS